MKTIKPSKALTKSGNKAGIGGISFYAFFFDFLTPYGILTFLPPSG
jgi:hypothetical protein